MKRKRPAAKKRPFKNDIHRSRMIFSTLQLMKGKNPSEISEITKRNGARGVCIETVRKFRLPFDDPCAVKWPSSRTIETIVYALGGKITVESRNEPED